MKRQQRLDLNRSEDESYMILARASGQPTHLVFAYVTAHYLGLDPLTGMLVRHYGEDWKKTVNAKVATEGMIPQRDRLDQWVDHLRRENRL